MTGLHVAEPQPLWFSLQHTPPSQGIAAALVEVVLSSLGIFVALVEVADTAVAVAQIAGSGSLFLP